MSQGLRCDGCKEMLNEESFLRLDHVSCTDNGPNRMPTTWTRGTKHFHLQDCLVKWVAEKLSDNDVMDVP